MRVHNGLAAFIGIVCGVFANTVLSHVAMTLFPADAALDWGNQDAVRDYITSLPIAAFGLVLLAHLSQSFVAAWVSARLQTTPARWTWLLAGGLSFVGGLMNFWSIPHPTWMYIELPLYFVVAAVGAKLGRTKTRNLPKVE